MPRTQPARPLLVLVFDREGMDRARFAPEDISAGGDASVANRVARLVDAGVDWLQVRERSLEADALYAFTRQVIAGARAARRPARVIVNRRIDIARAAGADGAHLGFDALAPGDARDLLGDDACIGVSCHGVDDVARASHTGADYVHLAPIFDPISKPAERRPLGLEVLQHAARAHPCVIAQGGLEPQRIASVIEAGASGIAVTGHVLAAPEPLGAALALRDALDAAHASTSKEG